MPWKIWDTGGRKAPACVGQGIGNDALRKINVPDIIALDNIFEHYGFIDVPKVVFGDLRLKTDAG